MGLLTDYSLSMATHRVDGDRVFITLRFTASSYLPWADGVTWITYQGRTLSDGSMLWKEEGGGYVAEKTERYLTRLHRHRSA